MPSAKTIEGIWTSGLVLMLRGQSDVIVGGTNAIKRQRLAFHGIGEKGPIYHVHHATISCSYAAPKWLFPWPIT